MFVISHILSSTERWTSNHVKPCERYLRRSNTLLLLSAINYVAGCFKQMKASTFAEGLIRFSIKCIDCKSSNVYEENSVRVLCDFERSGCERSVGQISHRQFSRFCQHIVRPKVFFALNQMMVPDGYNCVLFQVIMYLVPRKYHLLV